MNPILVRNESVTSFTVVFVCLFFHRTIPKGLPGAKAGSTSYSFTASEKLNGAKFQCSYNYPSTSGQQQKQFQSDQYTLAVRFSAKLDERSSTSNKDPIAVEVTGRTTIDCSFLANPQIEENDPTFKWVKVALKQPTDDSTSESEGAEKPVADQCSAVSANGIVGKLEEKVIVDGEDTELVPTQKKFTDGSSRTTFSLTIKNFDSSTDPGCYTCKLGSIERSFNVIELFVSPVKNNNSKDISTLKEVDSAYSMGAWSFTLLLTSTFLVHYLFSSNNNFS
ncbi:uncharacterized protein LOC142353369 [Convolutriloba macropyga]|uniref:uncharacterized protein LOC142353369 n=1 Tax=Convolutriloba macropyga TaxID=536237 RepID=UPI003F51D8CF